MHSGPAANKPPHSNLIAESTTCAVTMPAALSFCQVCCCIGVMSINKSTTLAVAGLHGNMEQAGAVTTRVAVAFVKQKRLLRFAVRSREALPASSCVATCGDVVPNSRDRKAEVGEQ